VSLVHQASSPWPREESGEDNLCAIIKKRNLTATIVMGSDEAYAKHVERCLRKGEDPVAVNAKFADKYGYSLRFYVDEEVPFLMRHGKNAMMGELRKIYGLADAMRPTGPQHGTWKTKLQTVRPDLVMWVDGDAHIVGTDRNPLTIEEVVRRACSRSEMPGNFARIIAQDSGSNVNAGWYIISARSFGIHFLHYLTELFEVYGPCKMWGQNLIQEALLVVMAGTPPPWPLVLPCSGEKYQCLTNKTLAPLAARCGPHDRACVLSAAAAAVRLERTGLPEPQQPLGTAPPLGAPDPTHAATQQQAAGLSPGLLNDCFGRAKYDLAPNAPGNWARAHEAIANQVRVLPGQFRILSANCFHETGFRGCVRVCARGHAAQASGCTPGDPLCCSGYNNFAAPPCNGGARHGGGWWGASGGGVVLLPAGDERVRFNSAPFRTDLLWHHGHGRLFEPECN